MSPITRGMSPITKELMGGMALGRKVLETGESFQLKEGQNPYIAHFGAKKLDIDAQNTYFFYLSN